MKSYSLKFAAFVMAAAPSILLAEGHPPSFVYETPQEFFATGDFDGDGRSDVVIVDKAIGKYRLGYQLTTGAFSWVDCRPSGIKGVTGFTVGRLLAAKRDALAFTSPDANQITILDVSTPNASAKPFTVPFAAALGPNTVVGVDAGGAGKTSLADLYVGSIYNSPEVNQATLIRNDHAEFPKLAETTPAGPVARGNRLALTSGQSEMVCVLVRGEKGDAFSVQDLSTGAFVPVATVNGLAAGSDYAVGNFRKSPLCDLIFYKPEANHLLVRPVEEPGSGHFQFGAGNSFDLGAPIQRVIALDDTIGHRLFVIFGGGEKAEIFNFDGIKPPVLTQTIVSTNESLTCALSFPGGFIAFSHPAGGKFSTRYLAYNASSSAYVFKAFGGLPSLADNDNIIIPDIRERIAANVKVKEESEMKSYTNTIPGTRATYVMVPIPGGEFMMGSPENEPGRKPDEGPQHKVKISPFWMQQCEVTWNEYELFMYPDEERRMRGTVPTNDSGDKLADAVTHPSKPYVEMSFGMGKDGFPAISMTQHAANKYCQWLSAKTGQFYRLPTEAEWEYACRAGTTTAYFFGTDTNKLGDYAWYEQNSDFKYQKVGKKKPNPWGLYDMCGNVVEWVLDQYDPDFYQQSAGRAVTTDPWNKATKPYPHSTRGGSWDDEAGACRSAARRGSDRTWKMTDPQLPKSIWYFSDAQFLGFRIVRPLRIPPPEEMQKCWTSGVERD
jgi:formylglycine-generating enzyme required for sulfatase activity